MVTGQYSNLTGPPSIIHVSYTSESVLMLPLLPTKMFPGSPHWAGTSLPLLSEYDREILRQNPGGIAHRGGETEKFCAIVVIIVDVVVLDVTSHVDVV